ncbi:MAG: ATP synthase subunit I [Methylococcales bacterium]|nr:ATP synthase subunit I [Methylococcales bacterium]MDD5753873.1 ATP synthase subunit I [Methylococcales bacterium]
MIANASLVIKILKCQILVILAVSLVLTQALDLISGWFAFLGGLIAFLPNAYLGFRIHQATKLEAKKFINSFYASESIKLVLTALFFLLVFRIPNVKLLPLLACYIGTLSVFWFALLMR